MRARDEFFVKAAQTSVDGRSVWAGLDGTRSVYAFPAWRLLRSIAWRRTELASELASPRRIYSTHVLLSNSSSDPFRNFCAEGGLCRRFSNKGSRPSVNSRPEMQLCSNLLVPVHCRPPKSAVVRRDCPHSSAEQLDRSQRLTTAHRHSNRQPSARHQEQPANVRLEVKLRVKRERPEPQ